MPTTDETMTREPHPLFAAAVQRIREQVAKDEKAGFHHNHYTIADVRGLLDEHDRLCRLARRAFDCEEPSHV